MTIRRTFPRRAVKGLAHDAIADGRIAEWEFPLDRDLAEHLDPGSIFGVPYFPTRWASVPDAAAQAVTELIGVRDPSAMFVVPAHVRRVERTPVYCPRQVFAVGADGIGLWVDDLPLDHMAGVIGYRDLCAIEHTLDGASAHLTVVGTRSEFTMHYRRSIWPARNYVRFDDQLIAVRRRATNSFDEDRVRGREAFERQMEDRVADAESMLMGVDRSDVIQRLERGGWRRRGGTSVGRSRRVAVITEHEFVVMRECRTPGVRSGCADILAVSRRHLDGVRITDSRICFRAGVEHEFRVGRGFARQLRRELAIPLLESPSGDETDCTAI